VRCRQAVGQIDGAGKVADSGLGGTMVLGGTHVEFEPATAALADLLGQESMPAFERRLRRYTNPDVLLLDQLGYLPCDSRAADILNNIISRRHEQRSTIITTNLSRYRPRPVILQRLATR